MKTRTEKILVILRILAMLGAVKFSIDWGAQLTNFVASFINPEWAKHTYQINMDIFNIREKSVAFYSWGMCIGIATAALKAAIWFVVFDLLTKLKMQTPFSMEVEKKLERIAFLSLGVWVIGSVFWNMYVYYLQQSTDVKLPANSSLDEYFFMAGMVYIISQIFKRGIEIEEENQLTV
jgi:hypothetical protein